MAQVLNCLGWLLVACAAIVLVPNHLIPTTLPDNNALVTAGILIALGGLLLTQAQMAKESGEKRSRFYLDSCVKAYEESRRLLSDGNNDRATWIEAGRALMHANELSNRVTIDPHRRVMELHKLKYRGFFHDAIAKKPATFFYGVHVATSLDEAAKASSAPEERGGTTVTTTYKQLSELSLYAVWEAAQWPQDYEELLDHVFSPEERDQLLVLFPGLHEYLEHTERWSSASGRLFPRNEEDA